MLKSFVVVCLLVVLAPSLMAEAADEKRAAINGFELVELMTPSGDGLSPPPEGTTSAPPADQKPPTLEDLGFATEQARGSAEAQARLDKRSHMLKVHQRLGLITLVPLLATVVASGGASGKQSSSSSRAVHGALGVLTVGLYSASAYYAIAAPRIPGTEVRGPIRLHKVLAWIHGAGMILTPILGAMADAQRNRGERVHGVASAHSAVADVTIAAYGASAGALAIKF
jgi:hypothetical protein